MFSRRTLTTSGLAAFITLPAARNLGLARQSTEAAAPFSQSVFHQNPPELPTAPEGEVAIVMQSPGLSEFVPIIYHNATDAVVRVTEVTATAVDAVGNEIDETSYGPIDLEPGQYGIAVFEFDNQFADGAEIEFQLSTEDDAELVDVLVTNVQSVEGSDDPMVHITVENPYDFELEDVVIAGIFFTPEGEILSSFATGARLGLEAGDDWNQSFSRSDLELSDSFVVAASGQNDA